MEASILVSELGKLVCTNFKMTLETFCELPRSLERTQKPL